MKTILRVVSCWATLLFQSPCLAQSSGPAPDPDGNRIEFQVDSFASTEETNAYMLSEAFASDPIGVQFDPEELADQFRAGVPEARLLARPDGPPARIPREHGIGTVTQQERRLGNLLERQLVK